MLTLSHLGGAGLSLMAIWVLASGAKLWAISYALALRIPPPVHGAVLCAGAGLAIALALLARPDVDHTLVVLGAGWLGALVLAIVLVVRPVPVWAAPLHENAVPVLQRSLRGVFYLLAGFYFYHLVSYARWVASDPGLILAQGSLVLLLIALVGGIAVNWWLRKPPEQAGEPPVAPQPDAGSES